jgi:hypothetical protein
VVHVVAGSIALPERADRLPQLIGYFVAGYASLAPKGSGNPQDCFRSKYFRSCQTWPCGSAIAPRKDVPTGQPPWARFNRSIASLSGRAGTLLVDLGNPVSPPRGTASAPPRHIWPSRGTEIRRISLLELPGQDTKVTVPFYGNSKMGAMTLRSAEIVPLKAQAWK